MAKSSSSRRWSVEKRLEFIDFQLYWSGQINRSDIMEKFGVSVPQASNDIRLYKESAPKNLEYDASEKHYFAKEGFEPAFFEPDSYDYLSLLRDDVNELSGKVGAGISGIPAHALIPLPRRIIDTEILRKVVSAINEKQRIDIHYQSMSSDNPKWRPVSPHALAYDGLRWHARSYCHDSHLYKDFILSRILDISEDSSQSVDLPPDNNWSEFFTIRLKPHPKLNSNQAEAVARDYGMENLEVSVEVRLALLYYFLRRLNLEDFEPEKRSPREQHVVIANKAETKKALDKAQYKSHSREVA